MCGCLLILLAFIVFVIFAIILIFSTIAFAIKAAISAGCVLLVIFVFALVWGGTR